MRRTALLVAAMVVLAAACGSSTELVKTTPTTLTTTTAAPAVSVVAAWTRVDTPQPPLVAGTVGYQLDNGRVLWVEERTGVGHVFANPDEVNADQWKCAALLGDVGAFYDRYRNVPNFDAVVCHPYSAGSP